MRPSPGSALSSTVGFLNEDSKRIVFSQKQRLLQVCTASGSNITFTDFILISSRFSTITGVWTYISTTIVIFISDIKSQVLLNFTIWTQKLTLCLWISFPPMWDTPTSLLTVSCTWQGACQFWPVGEEKETPSQFSQESTTVKGSAGTPAITLSQSIAPGAKIPFWSCPLHLLDTTGWGLSFGGFYHSSPLPRQRMTCKKSKPKNISIETKAEQYFKKGVKEQKTSYPHPSVKLISTFSDGILCTSFNVRYILTNFSDWSQAMEETKKCEQGINQLPVEHWVLCIVPYRSWWF